MFAEFLRRVKDRFDNGENQPTGREEFRLYVQNTVRSFFEKEDQEKFYVAAFWYLGEDEYQKYTLVVQFTHNEKTYTVAQIEGLASFELIQSKPFKPSIPDLKKQLKEQIQDSLKRAGDADWKK